MAYGNSNTKKNIGRRNGAPASKSLPDYIRQQEYGDETPEEHFRVPEWAREQFVLYCAHMDTRTTVQKIWAVMRNQNFCMMENNGILFKYREPMNGQQYGHNSVKIYCQFLFTDPSRSSMEQVKSNIKMMEHLRSSDEAFMKVFPANNPDEEGAHFWKFKLWRDMPRRQVPAPKIDLGPTNVVNASKRPNVSTKKATASELRKAMFRKSAVSQTMTTIADIPKDGPPNRRLAADEKEKQRHFEEFEDWHDENDFEDEMEMFMIENMLIEAGIGNEGLMYHSNLEPGLIINTGPIEIIPPGHFLDISYTAPAMGLGMDYRIPIVV